MENPIFQSECLHYGCCTLGEGPIWLESEDTLLYIDINGKMVNFLQIENFTQHKVLFDEQIGFATPSIASSAANMQLLVGLETKIERYCKLKQRNTVEFNIPAEKCANWRRFNDSCCSQHGELFVGYLNHEWNKGCCPGAVFEVIFEDNGSKLIHVADIGFPNGMVWENECTLFVVDSVENSISELSLTPRFVDGELMSRKMISKRTLFQAAGGDLMNGFLLDGMTVDAEGHLWVVYSGYDVILRIHSGTGEEMCRIALEPDTRPTSLTFGGKELRDLFVTTRGKDRFDCSGKILRIRFEDASIQGRRQNYVDLDMKKKIRDDAVLMNDWKDSPAKAT